jgi:hypothetical protein
MENSQQNLLSRFRQKPARQITVIQTDGTIVRAGDSTAHLSHLIEEALGGRRLSPQAIGQTPVDITVEDTPALPEDVLAALQFARRAS